MGRATLMVLAGLLGIAGCNRPTEPPPVVLGHVATLSGPDRTGERSARGIRLALEEVNTPELAEALAGRALHARHTDSRGQPDATEAEANRLVSVNRVIGLIGGETAEDVTRLDKAHVPVVATTGFRPAGVSDLVFAAGMRPSAQAWALAKHAAESANVVMVVDERREESLAFAEAFSRIFGQERKPAIPPVRIGFAKDAKWAELAKNVIARKPAALVFAGTARDCNELRRELAAPMQFLFAGDDGTWTGLDANSKQPVTIATAFAPTADVAGVQKFVTKYREAFKEEPDVNAAVGYEATRLFAEALKQTGHAPTPEKLRDALRGIKDLAGVAGPLTVTRDQYVQRRVFVGRFEGAGLMAVQMVAPPPEP